jgi:integrase
MPEAKSPFIYNMRDSEDIHDYGKRLAWALEKIKSEQRIPEEDRTLMLEYLGKLESKDLNPGRIAKYATTLLSIRLHMGVNFKEAKREDIERVVKWINESDFEPWTKYDYKGILKRFYRWLRTGALDASQPFPPEVAWIKTNLKRNEMKVPEVLTEDEVQAMIDKAPKLRDKAFIAVLYEGGFRIGEILPAKLGDLQFDENGARLRVHGKTGGRTVRLITSAPLLARWVDEHPYKDNPEAPIWILLTKNFQKRLQPMEYHYVARMLKETAKKAGIKKRVYPHIFRHSAATRDARYLTESELKLKYGWAGISGMAEVYVYLSGADLDNKLLAIYAGRPVETIRPKFAPIICPKCGQEKAC